LLQNALRSKVSYEGSLAGRGVSRSLILG